MIESVYIHSIHYEKLKNLTKFFDENRRTST